MSRPRATATAATLAALTVLSVAGCGAGDADSDSDTTTSEPEITREVSLTLAQGTSGTTLVATNEGDAEALVLLPVGDPDQADGADGTTLTYVRPEAKGSGEEPDLYEAVSLRAGVPRELDTSTIGDWPDAVRVCLEVVPADDEAASAGSDLVRVHGRDGGAAPVVACSDYGTIV